jgi:hypothetical protein
MCRSALRDQPIGRAFGRRVLYFWRKRRSAVRARKLAHAREPGRVPAHTPHRSADPLSTSTTPTVVRAAEAHGERALPDVARRGRSLAQTAIRSDLWPDRIGAARSFFLY